MGTIFAIILAGFLGFSAFTPQENAVSSVPAIIMIVVPTFLLMIHGLSLAFAWSPLQRAEQHLTSRIIEMFQKDRFFRFFNFWVVIFTVASMSIAIDLVFLKFLKEKILAIIWILLFGFTLDMLYHFYKHLMKYLDPFAVAEMFTKKAKESVQEDREMELCDWIDALSEISIKTIETKSSSLCIHCIEGLQSITHNFLESQKSISHRTEDSEIKALGVTDKVSFTLFYIFQRMETINQHALAKNMEPICSVLISVLGKIAVFAAKFDLTLVSYPLHYLEKFAKSAQDHNYPEIGVKASLTFVEVSKTIINEVDLTYVELQDPFINIVNHLDELAKKAFRHDKTTNISLLTQPLKDFKELFANPKVADHRDTPLIIQNIDRVLNEFATLEIVLKTMPPIPTFEEEPPPPSPKESKAKEPEPPPIPK